MKTNYLKRILFDETDQEFIENTGYVYFIVVSELILMIIVQEEMNKSTWILLFALGAVLCRIGYCLGLKASKNVSKQSNRRK